MLQIENSSPFVATAFVFPNREATETLYAVVKATFELLPRLMVAEEQRPIITEDDYWGEPGASSLRYPSEAHLEKPGTDVIVVGEACAPDDRLVTELEVVATVAGVQKRARVFGDRLWEGPPTKLRPSAPAPFRRIPLVYERCYGGTCRRREAGDTIACEPLNPVGCGFQGSAKASDFLNEPLPNVEDLRRPLLSPGQQSTPVGFGAIAPFWQARAQYAGTYDARWQKTRAPYLPQDFDPRFFNTAPEGWTFPKGLRGGEPVVAIGMSSGGPLRFEVPRCDVRVSVRLDNRTLAPQPSLETIVLEPTAAKMTMTWRAALPCDKRVFRIAEIAVDGGVVMPS